MKKGRYVKQTLKLTAKASKVLRAFQRRLNLAIKKEGFSVASKIDVKPLSDGKDGFIGIAIESWNTWKGDIRIKDCGFVREGRQLNGPSLTAEKLIYGIVEEVRAWDDYVKLHKSIDKDTQFIIGRKIVVSHDGDFGLGMYRVIFDKPIYKIAGKIGDKHYDVLELGPQHAIDYAMQYVRDAVPVEVQYLGAHSDTVTCELVNKTANLKTQIVQLVQNAKSSKSGVTLANTDVILTLAEHAGFYNRKRLS